MPRGYKFFLDRFDTFPELFCITILLLYEASS